MLSYWHSFPPHQSVKRPKVFLCNIIYCIYTDSLFVLLLTCGLAYFQSLKWSSKIFLVTKRKHLNIICKHCFLNSSRIFDGNTRELWILSIEVLMFSNNMTLSNKCTLSNIKKSRNNEQIFWYCIIESRILIPESNNLHKGLVIQFIYQTKSSATT